MWLCLFVCFIKLFWFISIIVQVKDLIKFKSIRQDVFTYEHYINVLMYQVDHTVSLYDMS